MGYISPQIALFWAKNPHNVEVWKWVQATHSCMPRLRQKEEICTAFVTTMVQCCCCKTFARCWSQGRSTKASWEGSLLICKWKPCSDPRPFANSIFVARALLILPPELCLLVLSCLVFHDDPDSNQAKERVHSIARLSTKRPGATDPAQPR